MKKESITEDLLIRQNLEVAGIDVGSEFHYVSVHPGISEQSVRKFGCYTSDLRLLAEWLQNLGIKSVAIESTGMYWYGIYLMLESYDIKVCLVNAHHVKHVPGRKTDIQDCQWLRELHSYGLLRSSHQPSIKTRDLRSYVRQRQSIVSQRNRSILQMQKAMDGMNIKLHEVLRDITGKSGILIIEAILAGERDSKLLANLADRRVKKSKGEISKALEGFWQAPQLFELSQAYGRYNFFSNQIKSCDAQIEICLEAQSKTLEQKTVEEKQVNTQKSKKSRKKKRKHEITFDVEVYLKNIYGVDICAIEGISGLTGLKILSECGTGLEINQKFRNAKAFVNWMSLCPNNKISGGKIISSRTRKNASRAAQAFRVAAMTLWNTKGEDKPLGAFYKKKKAQIGEQKAVTATARKMAVIFFNMVTKQIEYQPKLVKPDIVIQKKRRINKISKELHKLGYKVIDKHGVWVNSEH